MGKARLTKKRNRCSFAYIVNSVLLLLLAVVTFYPFWYVCMMTFSTNLDAQNVVLLLWPKGFTLDNLSYIIRYNYFSQTYMNTAFVVVVGTVLSILFTVLFAYPLSIRVKGTKSISYLAFFTLLFNGGMIPTFLVVKSTGLLNSLWSLIIPSIINPFNVFLMINFFRTIPAALSESAELDGAGPFKTLWYIILPVSLSGIATLTLFYAVAYWNAYFNAMIYVSDREKWTLQLLLREILISTQSGTDGGADVSEAARFGRTLKMATVFTAIIPIMMVYPFVQKYFVKGVMVGAVKG